MDEKLRERNACETELAKNSNGKEEVNEIRKRADINREKQVSNYAFNIGLLAPISQAS